jgi:hypothetical protein
MPYAIQWTQKVETTLTAMSPTLRNSVESTLTELAALLSEPPTSSGASIEEHFDAGGSVMRRFSVGELELLCELDASAQRLTLRGVA